MTARASLKIDSHLHVWATSEESRKFPYKDADSTPAVRGNTDYLVELMDEAKVDMAMIVQSSTHGFDHSYVKKAMDDFPDKFMGCLLANPDESGIGVSEMERLVRHEGFRCVRFNPYIWPKGQKMTNEIGCELFKKAGELNVPVGFMLFQGLGFILSAVISVLGFMLHVEEVETLCSKFPQTKVILDHFGFSKQDAQAWKRLLDMAKLPQVYVKSSAFFRNTAEQYPYLDMRANLRRLIDNFGPKRILWGTDFPWVIQQCSYSKAWNIINDGDQIKEETLLTPEEKDWINGGTARALFLS
eukprot:g9065.t1